MTSAKALYVADIHLSMLEILALLILREPCEEGTVILVLGK